MAAKLADGRARYAASSDIDAFAHRVGLERADAQTDYGNVLSILERGAEDPAERAIISAFVASGVVRAIESDPESARKWAPRLAWLGAHAGFDPLAALPDDVGPAAIAPLYRTLVELARHIDAGKLPEADRAELLVTTAALADAVEGPRQAPRSRRWYRGSRPILTIASPARLITSAGLRKRLATGCSKRAPPAAGASPESFAARFPRIPPW